MRRRLFVLVLALLMLPGCQDSGDRVLVGKFLYDTNVVPPQRYDVVVFKYPKNPIENGTPKNFIKRLIGLPGEIIAIIFGRLYSFHQTGSSVPEGLTEQQWRDLTETSPADSLKLWEIPRNNSEAARRLWDLTKEAEKRGDKGHFQILRKPPAVMQALSRLVFDNDHQAKDLVGVLPPRWAPEFLADWKSNEAHGFNSTGTAKKASWVRYRHILRPPPTVWPAPDLPDREARILEIKGRQHWPELITDVLGYNSYVVPNHPKPPPPNWVGDLMLQCKLTVEEPKGEFWMELSRGVDRFQARFDLATGVCSLYRWSDHKTTYVVENGEKKKVQDWQLLSSANTRIKARGDYNIKFANYDDRLTLWVGRDMPFEDGKAFPPPATPGPDATKLNEAAGLEGIENNDLQPASFCSVGAAIQVHNIRLWRDTYYTGAAEPANNNDVNGQVAGDNWKNPDHWKPIRDMEPRTYYVYPGHFFCLGDNSPESHDSRAWGLVPERLMLGRALLVYFPFDRAGTIK